MHQSIDLRIRFVMRNGIAVPVPRCLRCKSHVETLAYQWCRACRYRQAEQSKRLAAERKAAAQKRERSVQRERQKMLDRMEGFDPFLDDRLAAGFEMLEGE